MAESLEPVQRLAFMLFLLTSSQLTLQLNLSAMLLLSFYLVLCILCAQEQVAEDFKTSTLSALLSAPVSALVGVSSEAVRCLSSAGVSNLMSLGTWGPGAAAVTIAAAAAFEEHLTEDGPDAPKVTADEETVVTPTAPEDGTSAPIDHIVGSTKEDIGTTGAALADDDDASTAHPAKDNSESKTHAAEVGGETEESVDKEVEI